MTVETSRPPTPFGRAIDLPPPFRLVTLREVGDAFRHATAVAAAEGAGTLVHTGRFDAVEFAVVLEPEEPLRTARRAIYSGMCALGDALAAHAPPEKTIEFDWPDAVRVGGGLLGGGRLGWPAAATENDPPAWLVFGATIRIVAMGETDAGLRPLAATLEDEGFDDFDGARLVESFARYLMAGFDLAREKGFGATARNYLARLADATQRPQIHIDEDGDLLVRHAGSRDIERRSLVDALAAPSWLDPTTGGPRT